MNYDLFISHASEDKETFVRPIAQLLQKFGVTVWYDELSLSVGDSLSRSIDRGLSESRFGLVVLSEAFLRKDWPEYELRGLVAKEMGSDRVILPVWHNVSRDQLLRYSPPLADKFALCSDGHSVAEIAVAITEVIRPDLLEKIMRRVAHLGAQRKSNVEMIDPKKIVRLPPVHDELPFNLVSRVRLIRAALLEVYPHSMQFWIDGFRGDAHPSREIRIWEHVAACYLEYLAMAPLTHEQRMAVFSVISLFSCGSPLEEVVQKGISLPSDALEILGDLWKNDRPAYDIPNDAFPFDYEASENTIKRISSIDRESFPYDIPDELVFELLNQEPKNDSE